MSEPRDDIHNMAMSLGEIKGQLRELIHGVNANSQTLTALSTRIESLEAERNRREGASGVVAAVMKSPAFGWLVGGATTLWAILTGRLNL